MAPERFIASRLRFEGRMSAVAVAVSFFIMILAVSVSSGFRSEIRSSIAGISGDVMLTSRSMNYMAGDDPVHAPDAFLAVLDSMPEVTEVVPVIYRAGIVKTGSDVQGVIFKGVPGGEESSDEMVASIPSRLGEILALGPGDKMTAYFVGDKVKLRRFEVTSVYNEAVRTDDKMVVNVPLEVLRRLNDWNKGEVSAYEVMLGDKFRGRKQMEEIASEIGFLSISMSSADEEPLLARSAPQRYYRLFDWLDLIDLNVVVILILMTVVAGFNMISGLLILLFRNVSTIGTLKAMGMTDKGIASVFQRLSSTLVLKGMAIGNAVALLFCFLQGKTHLLKLNPENYFVSFVPVAVDFPLILIADAVAYVGIMLLLQIPCLFISKVDPAVTVATK